MSGTHHRIAVLDWLRAGAVLAVMAYHVVQMSPVPLPHLARFSWYGQYGVDLFFVLSGWLVGGLYWREAARSGSVETWRFWARRWMRTLPPYFAALALSWGAVHVARGEPFDLRYVLFLQNYADRMPYFLVSWSLCIEEHFYLAAPVVAALVLSFVPHGRRCVPWIVALAIPPLLRWQSWTPADVDAFGYYATATHLRLDGLVLGAGLHYAAVFAPASFQRLARWAPLVMAAAVAATIALRTHGGLTYSVFLPSVVAAGWAALLVTGLAHGRGTGTRGKPASAFLRVIAISSYSAYLMHPLAIHAARKLVASWATWGAVAYWPVVVALIAGATAAFFRLVEQPSIALRDAWVPARGAAASHIVNRRKPCAGSVTGSQECGMAVSSEVRDGASHAFHRL